MLLWQQHFKTQHMKYTKKWFSVTICLYGATTKRNWYIWTVLICFSLAPRPKYLEEENKTMWMIAVNFQSNKTNLVNKKETFRIKYLGILSLELSKLSVPNISQNCKITINPQPSPSWLIILWMEIKIISKVTFLFTSICCSC